MRGRCYDRWIKDGKLDSIDAKDRLERLQAAAVYLEEFIEQKEAAANRHIEITAEDVPVGCTPLMEAQDAAFSSKHGVTSSGDLQ